MKKMIKGCLLSLLLLQASISTAAEVNTTAKTIPVANTSTAVNPARVFTLSLGAGYEFFSSKRNLDNVVLPNISLGYNLTDFLAMELMAGLINTNSTQAGEGGVHGFLYTLDGIYRLPTYSAFAPYILAGVGVTTLKPNGIESVQQGNINAGIGTQYFVSKCIALRGDVRDIYTFVGGQNDVLLNFGVSFLLAF